MDMENSYGLTPALTMESFNPITSTELENIVGLTEEFIKESGLTTKCRATEFLLGATAENTMELT